MRNLISKSKAAFTPDSKNSKRKSSVHPTSLFSRLIKFRSKGTAQTPSMGPQTTSNGLQTPLSVPQTR
ncbi:hypothetical protein CDAR_40941 [Caerostris darwini]|uniref:Uncharacterized protein n=1 Tax=Caerostris darwini TaxID=1538125 RepID=A0AAV4VFH1_9ARAC|nr:hypothetical protein CDAR_40941 [Caerostris darwini]